MVFILSDYTAHMYFNLFKLFYSKKRKTGPVFLLLVFILHTQPLSASECVGAFKKAYSRYINHFQMPVHVKRVKKVTGLTDAEIKDSIILDVGSYFTYHFAEYARIKMKAKEGLVVNTFRDGPTNIDHHLYDVPEHRFLRMYPLATESQKTPHEAPPFDPVQIREKLGGTFADITISLSVVGIFNPVQTKLWMEQLTKVTKPEGIIIVDFGNHEKRNRLQRMVIPDFEKVLSQMKDEGLITSYAAQHVNRRFAVTRVFDARFPSRSVTYRIINGSQDSSN